MNANAYPDMISDPLKCFLLNADPFHFFSLDGLEFFEKKM
jgi:hypothetical protein